MAQRFSTGLCLSRQRLLVVAGRQCGRFSSATAKAAPAPPAPPKPQSLPMQFAAWYEACLAARPLPTKMVTSGVLYAVGDCMGQAIVNVRTPADEAKPGFDVGRFLRATAFGGIFYPPVAHVHYNFLEWIVVKQWQVSTSLMPWAKMFLEQFVYWGWFSNGYYHAVLGALQGMGPEQIYHRVADTLWDTLKAQWVFWIPVQLLNFKFVPLRHQVCIRLSAVTRRQAPCRRSAEQWSGAQSHAPLSRLRSVRAPSTAFSSISCWWSRSCGRPSSQLPSPRQRSAARRMRSPKTSREPRRPAQSRARATRCTPLLCIRSAVGGKGWLRAWASARRSCAARGSAPSARPGTGARCVIFCSSRASGSSYGCPAPAWPVAVCAGPRIVCRSSGLWAGKPPGSSLNLYHW